MSAVRNNDLAQIHMAKQDLGLADPDYRMLLSERYGVLTAAALGPVQRQDLLAEFERRGWKRGWPNKRPATRVEARSKDTPQLAKVRALLADGGKSAEYGDALAQRIAKVDRLEWCNPDQLGKLIAALVYDARRRQAKALELPAELAALVQRCPGVEGRVRGMYAGSMRNPRQTAERACDWVLRTLRAEAEAIARESGRDELRERKRSNALALIGTIDRIRLEVAHAR